MKNRGPRAAVFSFSHLRPVTSRPGGSSRGRVGVAGRPPKEPAADGGNVFDQQSARKESSESSIIFFWLAVSRIMASASIVLSSAVVSTLPADEADGSADRRTGETIPVPDPSPEAMEAAESPSRASERGREASVPPDSPPARPNLWRPVDTMWLQACGVLATLTAASAAASPEPFSDDRPSPETAAVAWVAARAWVDARAVPETGSENATVPLEGVSGVGVVLRLGGDVVGLGEDWIADDGMLRRAVGRAIAELAERPASDLPDALRPTLGPAISLELDLCGEPVPLAGSTFAAAASLVDPARDAVALRRGDTWHLATPGRLLAANLAANPEQTLRRLARDAELPAAEVKELGAIDSVGLYRLPTLRLAQRHPGDAPIEVVRAAAVVPLATIDEAAVEAMIDLLLGRLSAWMAASPPSGVPDDAGAEASRAESLPASLGLRGDYDPIAGRHRPLVASPFEQAMTALALARIAEASAAHRDAATALLVRLVEGLTTTDPIEEPVETSPEAMATLAIVFAIARSLEEESEAIALLSERARVAIGEAIASREAFSTLPAGRQALVATAAAIAAGLARDEAARTEASRRLGEAWTACDQARRVGLLPWFAWARRSLDGGIDPASLVQLRDALLLRQIGSDSGGETAPDLVGGFDLREGPLPQADSRSNVPAIGLAILLGDERITPIDGTPESMAALRTAAASHRAAIRFLRQLIADDDPSPAASGVRAAPWDLRQPILDQAIGLWLLAESVAAGVP